MCAEEGASPTRAEKKPLSSTRAEKKSLSHRRAPRQEPVLERTPRETPNFLTSSIEYSGTSNDGRGSTANATAAGTPSTSAAAASEFGDVRKGRTTRLPYFVA